MIESIRIDMQGPTGMKGISVENSVDVGSLLIRGLVGWNNNGILLYIDGHCDNLCCIGLRHEAKGGTPYVVVFDRHASFGTAAACPTFISCTLDGPDAGGGVLNIARLKYTVMASTTGPTG